MTEWAIKIGRRVRFYYNLMAAVQVYKIAPSVELWHKSYYGLWELISRKTKD